MIAWHSHLAGTQGPGAARASIAFLDEEHDHARAAPETTQTEEDQSSSSTQSKVLVTAFFHLR